MKINLIIFLFLVLAFKTNAQLVEISLSLRESCIDTTKQSIPIVITINNKSLNNCWIDLSSISYTIYEDSKIIEPYETTIIGYFKPESHINKKGLLFIEKSSKIVVDNFSSIFHNYHFKKGSEYRLLGVYKKPRKKIFTKICRQVIDTGYSRFSICD